MITTIIKLFLLKYNKKFLQLNALRLSLITLIESMAELFTLIIILNLK